MTNDVKEIELNYPWYIITIIIFIILLKAMNFIHLSWVIILLPIYGPISAILLYIWTIQLVNYLRKQIK
jgi:hypothetical protein